MAKYRVFVQTTASASVEVEIDETEYDDDFDLAMAIDEKAYKQGFPSICAPCSGWNRDFTLELSDVWELGTTQPSYGLAGYDIEKVEE